MSINLYGLDQDRQLEELFQRKAEDTVSEHGAKGAVIKANHGTLFMKGIEYLTLYARHQLLRTMLSKTMMKTDTQPLDMLDVRIIASSKVNLKYLVQQGKFSEELYYLLQGLILEIPSLNERIEELLHYFNIKMKQYEEKYNKTLKVTEEVIKNFKN